MYQSSSSNLHQKLKSTKVLQVLDHEWGSRLRGCTLGVWGMAWHGSLRVTLPARDRAGPLGHGQAAVSLPVPVTWPENPSPSHFQPWRPGQPVAVSHWQAGRLGTVINLNVNAELGRRSSRDRHASNTTPRISNFNPELPGGGGGSTGG